MRLGSRDAKLGRPAATWETVDLRGAETLLGGSLSMPEPLMFLRVLALALVLDL